MDVVELKKQFPASGRVEWIGLCTGKRGPVQPVDQVLACVGTGLEGDHHSKRKPGGKRQVTLIQREHIEVVAALLQRDSIEPEQLRRNIVVSDINLLALKECRFQIGDAVLEGSGPCAPCSRMETNLGPGGYNAMRGHGGITARVIEEGLITIGDAVRFIEPDGSSTDESD